MHILRFACWLLLVVVPGEGLCEEVFVGHVEQILLLPEGAERCPSPVSSDPEVVCIHNSCGCGEVTIRVEEVLVGPRKERAVIPYRLGEWCQADFPLTGQPVLVRYRAGEEPRWSALESHGKDMLFDLESFDGSGNSAFEQLEPVAGKSSLSALRRRVGL